MIICGLELGPMILREAKRESSEIFYAMREELHFYLKRTQLLETILAENSIPAYTGPLAPSARAFSPTVPEGSPTSRK